MPKIVINEVDLTTATGQLSSRTDVVYIPGLSYVEPYNDVMETPDSLVYCETVGDFEAAFGTRPAILDFRSAVNLENVEDAVAKIKDEDFDKYIKWCDDHYSDYSRLLTYNGAYKKWKTAKEFVELSDLGITLFIENPAELITTESEDGHTADTYTDENGNVFTEVIDINELEFKDGDTVALSPVYDLSYVYAKELLVAGLPVNYQVITGLIKSRDENDESAVIRTKESDIYTILKDTTVFDPENTEGILDKGEYSIKYLTSGVYHSFDFISGYSKVIGVSTYEKDKYYYIDEETDKFVLDTNNNPTKSFPDDYYEKDSNGYYSTKANFVKNMLGVAAARGDCVALIDASADACGLNAPLTGSGSLYEAAKSYCSAAEHLEYGAMFTPWGYYYTNASYVSVNKGVKTALNGLSQVLMPGSFGYLLALGKSIKNYSNMLAVAGVARGQVPQLIQLATKKILSNTIANSYQPRNGATSLNPITNIKPYGLTIWGNRTMHNNEDTSNGGEDGLVATSFLNTRNMVSDVKKLVYTAAKNFMFEQDSDILWVNFVAKITPTLDNMVSNNGLSRYKIIKVPTQEKAKLKATIKLYPLYAIEDFEVTIELRDEEVSIS